MQLGGDLRVGDVAGLAVTARRQPPQHRSIVDVEHAHGGMPLRKREGRASGGAHGRRAQVGAGDQQRATLRDEGLVDQRRIDCHVGAVLSVEDQREGVAVLQPEQHQRGQALRIDLHLRGVAALALQGLNEKAPHLLVADARDHRRAQTEPRDAERDVGRRAAEVLGKARRVFEPAAHLLRIEIDRQPTQAGQVEAAVGRKVQRAHEGSQHRAATILGANEQIFSDCSIQEYSFNIPRTPAATRPCCCSSSARAPRESSPSADSSHARRPSRTGRRAAPNSGSRSRRRCVTSARHARRRRERASACRRGSSVPSRCRCRR